MTHFYERNRKGRSEIWRFDLPSLVLRERRLVSPEEVERVIAERTIVSFIDPRGTVLCPQMSATLRSDAVINSNPDILFIHMPHSDGEIPLQLEKSASWIVALNRGDEGVILRLWTRDERVSTLRGRIELKGARNARFRLSEATLGLGDDQGRLLVFDLNTGDMLRNHRLC